MQLRCHTARDGHLFRKFGWGNRKSLVDDPAAAGLDVREALLAYYRSGTVRAELCCVVGSCIIVLPLCCAVCWQHAVLLLTSLLA
jgi:secreted Zn-dependent insulinase-like peptidase